MNKDDIGKALTRHIERFEWEKEQLHGHLAVLSGKIAVLQEEYDKVNSAIADNDRKIKVLQEAVAITRERKRNLSELNSVNFKYKTNNRAFKNKVSRLILPVLKANPEKVFGLKELVEAMLALDGQELATKAHYEAAGRMMRKMTVKGIAVRVADGWKKAP